MPQRVRVHNVREVTPGEPGGGGPGQIAITYSTGDVPPRTVFLDAGKDTPAERSRVIREDLEAARAAGAETLDLS